MDKNVFRIEAKGWVRSSHARFVALGLSLGCAGSPGYEFEKDFEPDFSATELSSQVQSNAPDASAPPAALSTGASTSSVGVQAFVAQAPVAARAPVTGAMADSSQPDEWRASVIEDNIEGPPGPPCDAVKKVFQVSCGGECHVGVGIGDFALGPEQALAYVGKAPNLNSPRCGLMIDPINPLNSLILTKVTGDYPFEVGECRTLMPPPFGGVTDDQIECLESWLWQFRKER